VVLYMGVLMPRGHDVQERPDPYYSNLMPAFAGKRTLRVFYPSGSSKMIVTMLNTATTTYNSIITLLFVRLSPKHRPLQYRDIEPYFPV